jgi:hypothetical protein
VLRPLPQQVCVTFSCGLGGMGLPCSVATLATEHTLPEPTGRRRSARHSLSKPTRAPRASGCRRLGLFPSLTAAVGFGARGCVFWEQASQFTPHIMHSARSNEVVNQFNGRGELVEVLHQNHHRPQEVGDAELLGLLPLPPQRHLLEPLGVDGRALERDHVFMFRCLSLFESLCVFH